MPDLESFLRAIGPPLRKMILNNYRVDSCIASTRIGMDLLEQVGIPSRPLAVTLMVFNAPFVRRIELEQRLPSGEEEAKRWVTENGAYSLGIGVQVRDSPGRHIALVMDDAYLWDLSADQASRPEHGIVIENPFTMSVTPEFLDGSEPIFGRAACGALAVYRARPGYDCWTDSPNWDADGLDSPIRAEMVAAAYRAIPAPRRLSR